MILAALAAPLMWGLWLLVALVAQFVGFPLIAALALFTPWLMLSNEFDDRRVVASFPVIDWFWLWENEEDGIDGLPMIDGKFFKDQEWMLATQRWSRWRRIFVWSAWRNSVNNQRYFWIFRLVVDPSRVHVRYFFTNTAYFIWQGLYSALYLTLGTRYIFIGYKFHQDDAEASVIRYSGGFERHYGVPEHPRTELADDDTRKPGAGFTFDLLKKVDPSSWATPIKH